jgi:hypothetical protein
MIYYDPEIKQHSAVLPIMIGNLVRFNVDTIAVPDDMKRGITIHEGNSHIITKGTYGLVIDISYPSDRRDGDIIKHSFVLVLIDNKRYIVSGSRFYDTLVNIIS